MDGALYASGGDGASFIFADYGQGGGGGALPANPCGDPPVPVGVAPHRPLLKAVRSEARTFAQAAIQLHSTEP